MRAGSLDLNEGISGSGMVGLRMDLGGGLAFAARETRRFPDPGFSASNPPGPILLLRDFFLPPLPAKELATSTVMFSFSILLRTGECPVDFLGRRVDGIVASERLDMLLIELKTSSLVCKVS